MRYGNGFPDESTLLWRPYKYEFTLESWTVSCCAVSPGCATIVLMKITTVCALCSQLLKWNGEEWLTAEWPEGLAYCGTISHPKHKPVAGEAR